LSLAAQKKKTQWFELDQYTFEDYVHEYFKSYSTPEEYKFRKGIFEEKLAAIKKHNQDSSKSWKKGINHMSDYTHEEYQKLLGYNKALGFAHWHKRNTVIRPHFVIKQDLSALPLTVDWRNQGVISAVKDQGQCGSCWSFGSTETLESWWALATGRLQDLSEQQILDCAPNPQNCGGTGGCGGGIVDIAWQKIIDLGGIQSEWTYPYLSWPGNDYPTCKFDPTKIQANLSSFVSLPTNEYWPVMNVLATLGPLAINVDASLWNDYEYGVFTGCNMTSIDINHVVQLVGYGTDDQYGDYWLVRNSWTPSFGENGYIRIARSSNVECGMDNSPQDGTGCDGGPPQVQICSACGIVFDALYPIITV